MKFVVGQKPKADLAVYSEKFDKKQLPQAVFAEVERLLEKSPVAVVRTLGLCEAPAVVSAKVPQKSALDVRRAYGQLAQAAASLEKLGWSVKKNIPHLRSALVGLSQGAYTFDRYKKTPTPSLQELHLQNVPASLKSTIKEAEVFADAIAFCRDLINTPTEDMGPDEFVKAAQEAARGTGLKLAVMDEADCKKEKMGALLAVGRASHRRARMLTVEWAGPGKANDKSFLALCGKGVCFDTGGLNIKMEGSMLLMRKDMGGAATVLAAMLCFAKLKAKTRIKAYLPLVENAIGPEAFRPGDVLTVCDGTTVEIGNTDAEGRLILADAIAFAKKQGAKRIVSVATLTGAAKVALGTIHVPIMGEHKLIAAIKRGAVSSGEKVWQLPMDEEHKKLVRGKVADLTNSDGSGEAGCITAGAFLSHFAGETPFAHCDISPASWKTAPHELGPAGATGILVTTLVDAFR